MKKFFLFLILLLAVFTVGAQVTTIKKKYYTIYFHEKQKIPLYTFYVLKKSFLSNNTRHGSFKPDPAMDASKQATSTDYNDDSYDKGHFTPDADFRFNSNAEAETFLFTNAAPQQDYLNEHLWANLELHVRNICSEFGDVRVFTGCLFGSKKMNGIDIPAYFWKVIIYKKNGENITEAYKVKNARPDSNIYTAIQSDFAGLKQTTGLAFTQK